MPRPHSLLVAAALALSAGAAPVAAAAPPQAPALIERRWTQDDGLPQNAVAAVAQTADGALWVGTQEGLARFDGAAWEGRPLGLPCRDVLALHAEPGPLARLWVGTSCGLVRLEADGARARHLRTPGGEPGDDHVQAFLAGPDGAPRWVGSAHGLFALEGERLRPVEALGHADVSDLAPDEGGALWVGTRQGGLVRLSADGQAERVGAEAGLGALQVEALARGPDGTLWVGARGGLWRLGRGERRLAPVAGLAGAHVSRLRVDAAGSVWVGTEDAGLLRGGPGRAFRPVGGERLRRAFVRALGEDRERSLWVGTAFGGLSQLREGRVRVVGEPEGLGADVAWSVLEDRAGNVWVGTEGGGLHRLAPDGTLTRFGPAEGVPPGGVLGLSEARDGALWLGTTSGAARFDGRRFRRLTTRDGLPSDVVFHVHEDPAGGRWFLTDVALAHQAPRGGPLTVYGAAAGVSPNGVNALLDAPGGGLWLGTPGGLVRFRDGRAQRAWRVADGLPGAAVSGLAWDRERPGVLWISTEGGLARLTPDGTLGALGPRHGLPDTALLSVVDDGRGSLWASSNRGVFRLPKAALEAALAGGAARVEPEAFGRADGLRSTECNSAGPAASLRARDGALWFPTTAGVVRIDPAQRAEVRPPPPLVLQRVLSQGAPVDPARGLDGGAPDVEFHYAAHTFAAPEAVRYRYRLEGYDTGWVEAGTRRQAFYTNLPPGAYRFRVQVAGLPDGAAEASFAFRRAPRGWESPWVRALGALALVLLGGAAFGWRGRRLRARERELTLRVAERTRALALANAELSRLADASAESARTVRRLIDQLPMSLSVFVDERAVYANATALALLGYARAEDYVGTPLLAHYVSDGSQEELERERLARIRAGANNGARELQLRRVDGSLVLVEAVALKGTWQGQPAIIAVARDVTEARRMEAHLRLSDRMASVGSLAAGVAHEINNPLSFVLSNVRFGADEARALVRALEAGDPPSLAVVRELAQALDEAAHGADRVKHIVRDLKTFSRGGEEAPRRLDLRGVLESTLSMGHNEVRHRARLRKELGEVPHVLASEARLGQVFLNLVVNAAQAIREGAADQNEIAVRTYTDEAGRAVVEVQDTGSGIAPENLKRIWDPFFTTKPVGVGTGLGLSICHNLVTTLGGDIRVESVLGQGTTFRVVLPAAEAPAPAPEPPAPGPAAPAPALPRARILVVDDEPLVAKSLVRLLGHEHRAEAVDSARAALERLARGERFDLVFCDVMMPEMGGQDFWEALGSVAPEQRERMVFITGGAFTAEARAFLAEVGARVVTKPFDPAEVRALVRERLQAAA